MKLLHVDASILGAHSVSRAVSAAIVHRLEAETPGVEIIRRDLTAAPLAHLSGGHLAAAAPDADVSAETRAENAEAARALDEFLQADVVVIGAPMYNFSIPSQLKAWIDRVLVAGRTFRYDENGRVVGLAGDKRVIVAVSRGGFYGADTPMAAFEHVETYLKAVFAFIGVPDVEFVVAEGVMAGPGLREKALDAALQDAGRLKAA
ncbi:FMN-dependent NADH-azoreductase [Methylopila capsulata]|uniref:FMN dependent NADH:quinone oxidoreductase n=1 Tax=Methylopila capsulata TaxID=61654 RepID=A0A9W6IRV2_9HYPH|nr:NAD(P)H-dependent oxidoreductase [Methylopila capsulata]MBM7851017.1 FMN-dependent NADH-azoreductase [Methylopila capsulata]GLK54075.1 FMN-dependent NADH-azoreductase 2 [Methylopila capsulata]